MKVLIWTLLILSLVFAFAGPGLISQGNKEGDGGLGTALLGVLCCVVAGLLMVAAVLIAGIAGQLLGFAIVGVVVILIVVTIFWWALS